MRIGSYEEYSRLRSHVSHETDGAKVVTPLLHGFREEGTTGRPAATRIERAISLGRETMGLAANARPGTSVLETEQRMRPARDQNPLGKLRTQEESRHGCRHGRSDQALIDQMGRQGSAGERSLNHIKARLLGRHRLSYLWRAPGMSTPLTSSDSHTGRS